MTCVSWIFSLAKCGESGHFKSWRAISDLLFAVIQGICASISQEGFHRSGWSQLLSSILSEILETYRQTCLRVSATHAVGALTAGNVRCWQSYCERWKDPCCGAMVPWSWTPGMSSATSALEAFNFTGSRLSPQTGWGPTYINDSKSQKFLKTLLDANKYLFFSLGDSLTRPKLFNSTFSWITRSQLVTSYLVCLVPRPAFDFPCAACPAHGFLQVLDEGYQCRFAAVQEDGWEEPQLAKQWLGLNIFTLRWNWLEHVLLPRGFQFDEWEWMHNTFNR